MQLESVILADFQLKAGSKDQSVREHFTTIEQVGDSGEREEIDAATRSWPGFEAFAD